MKRYSKPLAEVIMLDTDALMVVSTDNVPIGNGGGNQNNPGSGGSGGSIPGLAKSYGWGFDDDDFEDDFDDLY